MIFIALPESVLEFFVMKPPKLRGNKLQIIGLESEGFDLCLSFHRPCRRGEIGGRVGVQGPCEKLFSAEVTSLKINRVEEAGSATISGHSRQSSSHDKEHFVNRITLSNNGALLCVEGWLETVTQPVQELFIHFLKQRHLF